MKRICIIILVIVVATAFTGYRGVALAASQSEGAIPQSGDLCGGTGGNGQIVSVGNNTFTIKRSGDGSEQTINLTSPATIETSAGPASLSDLKTGDRVTLVGGPNPDGSFTADTVVVCAGTQGNVSGQGIQSGQIQNADFNKAKTWSSYMDVAAILLAGLIWIDTLVFFRLKKKKSFVCLPELASAAHRDSAHTAACGNNSRSASAGHGLRSLPSICSSLERIRTGHTIQKN